MAWFHNKKNFLKAAREGDIKEVEYCLSHCIPGKFDIDAPTESGQTALHLAAQNGDAPMTRLLLDYGAGRDVADSDGVTPLMAAALNGKPAAALELVARGAHVNTHNAEYIYPLHLAAYTGDVDFVKALVAAKADLDVTIRNNGRTALHWAVDKDHSRIVELLLLAGARTDIADKGGKTALEFARAKGLNHVAKLFKPAAPPPQDVPAAAPVAAGSEYWTLTGKSRLSHSYADVGRRITEIFNFESRERMVISENLKTGAETLAAPESFDALGEDALRKALTEFRRLGGEAKEDFVMGGKVIKKSLRF